MSSTSNAPGSSDPDAPKPLISLFVAKVPNDPHKLDILTHLLTCCFYFDTIRGHLALTTRTSDLEVKHTLPSNQMTAFLACIPTIHAAEGFIEKIVNKYRAKGLESYLKDHPEVSSLLHTLRCQCAQRRNSPLRTLGHIRNNLSSHISHNFTRQFIEQRFVEISSYPLLLMTDGKAWTTSSPLTRRIAELYCFRHAKDDDEIRNAVGELRELASLICKILFELNLWMQDEVAEYLHAQTIA